MAKIQIITTPPGEAPLEVREAWVGLELPLVTEFTRGLEVGVLTGKPQNSRGYRVNGGVAIGLLEAQNPDAAAWWKTHCSWVLSNELVFKADVCVLIN